MDSLSTASRSLVWALVASAVVGVGVSSCMNREDVNDQLAQTTRAAIDSAERSRRVSDAAHLAPARWRLLAIALGTGTPLAVATITLWIVTRSTAVDLEVLGTLEAHGALMQPNTRCRCVDHGPQLPGLSSKTR